MEGLKEAAVAGERKAVASRRFSLREAKGCGEPGSIDPEAGENSFGGVERRIVRCSQTRCSVPCMTAVGSAGNRVTWNHFSLVGHALACPAFQNTRAT